MLYFQRNFNFNVIKYIFEAKKNNKINCKNNIK